MARLAVFVVCPDRRPDRRRRRDTNAAWGEHIPGTTTDERPGQEPPLPRRLTWANEFRMNDGKTVWDDGAARDVRPS